MKNNTEIIWNHSGLQTFFLFTLSFCLFLMGGISAMAGEIFNTDFSKGKIAELGWEAKGDWAIKDYGADKPGLAKNPGPLVKFAANGTEIGMLSKKFDPISNPSNLTLTFDAGYGWGAKDHCQSLAVMLVDADGNGYIFTQARANATWGVMWDKVIKYAHGDTMQWAPAAIDATQQAVIDGGGLLTFTITRDTSGNWKFNRDGWTAPLTFTDKMFTSFSQVVLVGNPNNDELLYNKIKLDMTK